jgi:hypothetical protein
MTARTAVIFTMHAHSAATEAMLAGIGMGGTR